MSAGSCPIILALPTEKSFSVFINSTTKLCKLTEINTTLIKMTACNEATDEFHICD